MHPLNVHFDLASAITTPIASQVMMQSIFYCTSYCNTINTIIVILFIYSWVEEEICLDCFPPVVPAMGTLSPLSSFTGGSDVWSWTLISDRGDGIKRIVSILIFMGTTSLIREPEGILHPAILFLSTR